MNAAADAVTRFTATALPIKPTATRASDVSTPLAQTFGVEATEVKTLLHESEGEMRMSALRSDRNVSILSLPDNVLQIIFDLLDPTHSNTEFPAAKLKPIAFTCRHLAKFYRKSY